jgi:Na+-driven multidrug efflux pump
MLNLLGSAVRGTGNMTFPAAIIVGSVLGHILISPLLIFGWGPLPALADHGGCTEHGGSSFDSGHARGRIG